MSKIQEHDLLKALNELEEMVAKGDALQNADTEGGLSTEGKPLSSQAPSGKSDAAKAMSASDVGSGDAGDDESEDEGGGDDDSGGDAMSKSFYQQETIKKAIEVSQFIEAMVDQTTGALGTVQKSLGQVSAALNERINKSENSQRDFNSRLAKAVVQMGNAIEWDPLESTCRHASLSIL